MKRVDPGQRAAGGGGRKPSLRGSRRSAIPSAIPMEWMDPMSWRLPSGKALAEFALQAGFLAPLMLSGPQLKRGKKIPVVPLAGPESQVAGSPGISGPAISSKAIGSQVGEEPEPSGTFRKTGGYGEGGFRQGR